MTPWAGYDSVGGYDWRWHRSDAVLTTRPWPPSPLRTRRDRLTELLQRAPAQFGARLAWAAGAGLCDTAGRWATMYHPAVAEALGGVSPESLPAAVRQQLPAYRRLGCDRGPAQLRLPLPFPPALAPALPGVLAAALQLPRMRVVQAAAPRLAALYDDGRRRQGGGGDAARRTAVLPWRRGNPAPADPSPRGAPPPAQSHGTASPARALPLPPRLPQQGAPCRCWRAAAAVWLAGGAPQSLSPVHVVVEPELGELVGPATLMS